MSESTADPNIRASAYHRIGLYCIAQHNCVSWVKLCFSLSWGCDRSGIQSNVQYKHMNIVLCPKSLNFTWLQFLI